MDTDKIPVIGLAPGTGRFDRLPTKWHRRSIENFGFDSIDYFQQVPAAAWFFTNQIRSEPQRQRHIHTIKGGAPQDDAWAMHLRPQLLQHVHSVAPRHLKIEQYQVRIWKQLPVFEIIDSLNISQSFGPIMDETDQLDRWHMSQLGAEQDAFILGVINNERSEWLTVSDHNISYFSVVPSGVESLTRD
jgi:hypothetical protein